MNKLYFYLLFFALSCNSMAQTSLPADFDVAYKLNKFGMDAAKANVSLKKQQDGSWIYHSQTRTSGLISIFRKDVIIEETVLKAFGQDIKPTRYQYIHQGSKKNRNRSIIFDWDEKLARCDVSGNQTTLNINNDTIDSFSLQLKIMSDLKSGHRDLHYSILKKGEIDDYQFEIMGEETVATNAGDYSTLQLKRSRHNSKRTTIMWVAPVLDYLPVKMTHIESDGSEFSLIMESVTGDFTSSHKQNDVAAGTRQDNE